jgi:hypothetical protein
MSFGQTGSLVTGLETRSYLLVAVRAGVLYLFDVGTKVALEARERA